MKLNGKKTTVIALVAGAAVLFAMTSFAEVRIKDIASVEGARDNQLIGYGLVVGLSGTGDKNSTQFTVQSIVNTAGAFWNKCTSGQG